MKTHFVVTGILQHKGKILILKKAEDDYNYPNKWSFCSGYLKEFEAAEDAVIREIKEETGLEAIRTNEGKIIEAIDAEKQKRWMVMVFGCKSDSDKVELCKENADFAWIKPQELHDYDCVPGLSKDLKTLGIELEE